VPGKRTRIVVADDHELFLAGLVALLEKEPDLEIVAKAKDGREALRAAREREPDLVITDLEMPGLNGIEATRRITSELPRVKVLCVSMYAESHFVEAAFEAGALGYLLKDCALDELVRAIHVVTAGRTYISPSVAGTVVDVLRENRPRVDSSAFAVLTDREREVLQLLAEGRTTREIASELYMSPKTVATHREHLMAKLRIRSIAGLTKYAILHGLTSSQPDYTPES